MCRRGDYPYHGIIPAYAGSTQAGDETLATEALAEMFAAEIVSPEALGKTKEYFPKSYELFREMLEGLA